MSKKLAKLISDHSFVERAARRAHDTIAFMCATGAPPWSATPEWKKAQCRNGVRWVLANPSATPEELHNQWVNEMSNNGWQYGPVKDEVARTHPCMVEYGALSRNDQLKDEYFISSVLEVSGAFTS